jgi:dipeptidyl aminopeptidase/acylaminoacyl peptidase
VEALRRRRGVAAAVLAAGAVLVVGAVLAWRSSRAPSRSATAPGGPTLVYEAGDRPSDASSGHIVRAAADGAAAVTIADGQSPAVSPDGRWIAFLRYDRASRSSDLSIVAAGGGRARPVGLPGGPYVYRLAWSPDSTRLVALTGSGLVVVDRSDRRVHRLRTPGPPGFSRPSVSPDSRRVVFASGRAGSDVEVATLPGGPVVRLTRDHHSFAPVWGPAGIAYSRECCVRGDIWLMQPDGSHRRRLTRTEQGILPVDWSANGHHLLAVHPGLTRSEIWAVDTTDGEARGLTVAVPGLEALALSRDGQRILYATGCNRRQGDEGTIETIPFGGGPSTVLAHASCRADWNA